MSVLWVAKFDRLMLLCAEIIQIHFPNTVRPDLGNAYSVINHQLGNSSNLLLFGKIARRLPANACTNGRPTVRCEQTNG